MKRTIFPALIAATCCIAASCSKSKDKSITPTTKPNDTLYAIVDGKPLTKQHCGIGWSSLGGLDIFSGSPKDSQWIELAVTNYTTGATGTYSLTTYPDVSVTAVLWSPNMGEDGQTGSITITSASDSVISGTFSFTCVNGTIVHTVTNGIFTATRY